MLHYCVVSTNFVKMYASCFECFIQKQSIVFTYYITHPWSIRKHSMMVILYFTSIKVTLRHIINIGLQWIRPSCSESGRACQRIWIVHTMCPCSIDSEVIFMHIGYLHRNSGLAKIFIEYRAKHHRLWFSLISVLSLWSFGSYRQW